MKPFKPQKLPLKKINWESFLHLIGKANAEVARFDGFLQTLQNPGVLLSPLSTREAVLSSKIEGTQATLEEVLEFEVNPQKKTERYDDIQEIINYGKAMLYAINKLNEIPLTFRLVKKIQEILLSGARGQGKNPGNFRSGQVHLGKPGLGIESATFIPPESQEIPDYCSNLEKYIHSEEKDVLVQLAIVHAQFEIIHPFWDGNGRTGRIIMPLFLYYKKILSNPTFYLSEYFEKYREEYYDRLNGISQNNDWESWIAFFLQAVIDQSQENIKKARSIVALYDKKKEEIADIPSPKNSIRVLDFLFTFPIFDSRKFIKEVKTPKDTSFRILRFLSENKIIQDNEKTRNKTYFFNELIRIVS
jgi:Fic family protein